MFWNKWKKKTQIETVELTDNGFVINHNGLVTHFDWSEITCLTGFKIDRLTFDEICLKIEAQSKFAILTESFSGWRFFVNALMSELPEIEENWEGIIAQPPFERNETILFSKAENENHFHCTECGIAHSDWPSLAFKSPANYDCLTEQDKSELGTLNSDFCEIRHDGQVDRFIRVTLTQKVNDNCQNLDYGLWVSLIENSYLDYKSNFDNEDHETGYFGWLCNNIPEYGDTMSIPCDVMTKKGNSRPEIFPHQNFDHPFVRDYYDGISQKEAKKRIDETMKNIG
ncbi:MAG: DUF2199 domain-containing protein [Flavobacteriales bacterium]|nr:DUF2199 domain-containing protein [Flavobacteriales bacterium]